MLTNLSMLPPAPALFNHSNYRACVRAHRAALQSQKVFWQALLHDTIPFHSLQSAFINMHRCEGHAATVYKRWGGCLPWCC